MSGNTYKFIYFDAQGRGEVSRYLFALSNTEYDDHRVERSAWPALKPTTPYGQLPVLEFNGTQYCQSDAINRFLARQFNLYGKDELDGLKIDQILGVFNDLFSEYVQINYVLQGEAKEKAQEKIVSESLPKLIAFLEKQLDKNDFLVGNSATLADVNAYDILGFKIPSIVPGWTIPSDSVAALIKRFGDIPAITDYVARRPN